MVRHRGVQWHFILSAFPAAVGEAKEALCHFGDASFGRNRFLPYGCAQRCVETAPELGCSRGQSPTAKPLEVSGEMIRESDRSHSSRQDHPHPMGAVEAWKSFCLRVYVCA